MDRYLECVIRFLQSNADRELPEITEDSHLIGDLGFNSLEMVQMVNDAEQAFDIVIEDDEMPQILTVGDFIALLKRKNAQLG
ncbi:MAG: acyl carrier protein [Clostridia bacterium]|nr:acyl carrier protein [Clostridia bacterium]